MLSKNQLKLINSLRLSKNRQEEGLFIAEGVKLVDELLSSDFAVEKIFATDGWISGSHIPKHRYLVDIVEISQQELEKISVLNTPNQVLAIARIPETHAAGDFSGEWVLALDQIRDPGNLGTIIRTADWFGIDRIVAASGSVDIWNPKVVQASMGSVFRMPFHYVDLQKFLNTHASQVPVYGTLLEGEDVTTVRFKTGGIVVIGNESHGISEEIIPLITGRITIPGALKGPKGRAESLNASIAAALICYEIRRQHPLG